MYQVISYLIHNTRTLKQRKAMQHIYLKHTSDSALKKLLISFASQSPNCLRALISGVEQALPSFLQSSDLAIKKH
jgi:hypothetical protein